MLSQQEFEQLIADAGLTLLLKWAPRFVVSLRVPQQFGTRYLCEVLAYAPAEFAMLTPERAKQQIAACRAKLERAAKTKQGVIR